MTALIYNYYEKGVLIPIFVNGIDVNKNSYSYKCKFCHENNIKNSKGEDIYVKAQLSITSNLIKHLKTARHEEVLLEYESSLKKNSFFCTPERKKMKFDSYDSPVKSPILSLIDNGFISNSPKYKSNSCLQKERY
jgi:hypothetical protein